jgi:hypothetical protein
VVSCRESVHIRFLVQEPAESRPDYVASHPYTFSREQVNDS